MGGHLPDPFGGVHLGMLCEKNWSTLFQEKGKTYPDA